MVDLHGASCAAIRAESPICLHECVPFGSGKGAAPYFSGSAAMSHGTPNRSAIRTSGQALRP